ncbi:HTH_Tnp_Tc3_2 domain-containing protein [Trichonephila clavipes]|nr:HTH_Tnp_Tc3_2 domain-containing protein [Trichonephila clavipes]
MIEYWFASIATLRSTSVHDKHRKIPWNNLTKSRFAAYRHCGLLYRSIAARVGRDPMTGSRIWSSVQDSNTERRAGFYRLPIISSREDRHVIFRILIVHAASSRPMSQELGSFVRQQA